MEIGDERVRKILMVRMSAIGDVVLTLPVIEALAERFEGVKIDYVTRREFAGLVRHHPAVARVWEFDRAAGFAGLRELARRTQAEHYDLIIDLHYNLRSAYLRWASGAVMRRSYRKLSLARRLLARTGLRMNLLRNAPPVVDRYFTALEDFGIVRAGRKPRLYLDEAARDEAARVLAEFGILAGETGLIAVAPGASRETKRWSVAGYAAAAAAVAGSNHAVVVLGDDKDRELAGLMARGMNLAGTRTIDLAGRLPLLASAAVIERSAVLLTNDSGLMHVADALGTPLVAIFGPTSRELGFYPSGGRARVLEVNLPCRPCTLHGDPSCPKVHHRCMNEIAPEAVAEAAREVMQRPGP